MSVDTSRVRRGLALLHAEAVFRWGCGLGATVFAIFSILSLEFGLTALSGMFLFFTVGTAALLFKARLSYQLESRHKAEKLIEKSLSENGLEQFDLDEALEGASLPEEEVQKAAESVYKDAVAQSLKDTQESPEETAKLDKLCEKLEIGKDVCSRIRNAAKEKVYSKELDERLSDGKLTEKEQTEIRLLRTSLGVSTENAYKATSNQVKRNYRRLFHRFVEDGHLSLKEQKMLRRFRQSTGLPASEAAHVTRDDAIDLYRRTVQMICQDGRITDAEKGKIETLKDILSIPLHEIENLDERLQRTEELDNIRQGQLPTVDANGLDLDKSETCRWRGECTYEWESHGQIHRAFGELALTDDRVIFAARDKEFDFPLKQVLNIRRDSGVVNLELTGHQGEGRYSVGNLEKLEAVLCGIVNNWDQSHLAKSDSRSERQIPDEVKIRVWRRDGGRCSKCGATEELEYHHVVPCSKGGSNRAENVRIICRSCRRKKKSQISA
ncbi:MAG: HNH endonuclease [Candidatus Brocadiia bacterium]